MFGDESQNEEILINSLNMAIVDPKEGGNDLLTQLNKKMKDEPMVAGRRKPTVAVA